MVQPFLKVVYIMEPPAQFATILKELNQRYFLIVDEVIQTYPKYKSNPKMNSYGKVFERNMSNLQKLQGDYFLFKNNLSKDMDQLQKDIKQIDEMIYKLEEANKILREEYTNLKNSDNAAHGRLTDSETLYNQQLIGNWLILLYLSILTYKLTTF